MTFSSLYYPRTLSKSTLQANAILLVSSLTHALACSLDPVITRFANPEAKFTSVLFAKNTDCLLVGDSRGEVSVFELQNLAASSSTEVRLPGKRWWSSKPAHLVPLQTGAAVTDLS